MSFSLGMFIEIIVAVLLVLTIGYCMLLNKRLTRLRADEEVLRATISELITATEIAERAILGLKATAAEADKSLGARFAAAQEKTAEIDRHIASADDVIRRLVAASARAGAGAAQPVAKGPSEPVRGEPLQAHPNVPAAAPQQGGYGFPTAGPAVPAERAAPAAPTPAFVPAPGFAAAPAYGQAFDAPAAQPVAGYGQPVQGYGQPAAGYGQPVAGYAPQPEPAPAPREPVARSLQAAAEAAANRMSAYRRGRREEAA